MACALDPRLADVELGHGGFEVVAATARLLPRSLVEQRPRRLELDVHVDELGLHELELADLLAVLLALVGVPDGCLEQAPHRAHGAGQDAPALPRHGVREQHLPRSLATETIFFRHRTVFKEPVSYTHLRAHETPEQ